MCVFSAASPPKKHTLVLFEAVSKGSTKIFQPHFSRNNATMARNHLESLWHYAVE